MTTNDFIIKAKLKHGDKYDYSKVEYINTKTKICIICPTHGEFYQTPNKHLSGKGCNKCNGGVKLTNNEFIEKSKLIHGSRYDYSKVEYINSSTKVKIICEVHGEFKQNPHNHIRGSGCPLCSGVMKLNSEEFIERANKTHNNKFDYNKVDYINTETKVCIICKKHGEFWQSPYIHLSGCGCQKCNDSVGEDKIKKFLIKNNIEFIPQKTFEKCKNIRLLPFDFYLPEYNLCIEYDGRQHFEIIEKFGGINEFKKIQIRDKIKTDFCEDNNINLIRIPHIELKKIENILKIKLIKYE